jgi:hypothetical protein
MECPVCYSSDFENGDLLWLQCLHPLCTRCLKKLVRNVCPLCRSDIKAEELIPENKTRRAYSDSATRTVRVRARRRRRQRHTYIDTMDLDGSTSLVVESYEDTYLQRAFRKSKKNPNRKERSGKGNWATRNGRTHGRR